MARLAYGVWDGKVHDNRGKPPGIATEIPDLKGFDVFNADNPIRAFLGDRGFFVFDPRVHLIDAFWRYMNKAADESCGKCTPCRIGTLLVRDALADLRQGAAADYDFDTIQSLCRQMADTSLCGVGQTCAKALLAALEHFRDIFEAEAAAGPAPAQPGLEYVTAPCVEACPSKIDVPRYIDYIRDGKPEYALGVILQKYPMAATCGRVCVRFCEMACRRNMVDDAVGIKTLKRYVADHQLGQALRFTKDLVTLEADARVAVVGAGPAGISCAYHLLLHGYEVDIFETRDEAGGMASIGIPSYRLPKSVLKSETDTITTLGGRLLYNQTLGVDFTLDDLFARGYSSVFLGLGCQEGALMGVPGEDVKLKGYETGIGFLLKVHDHIAGIDTSPLSDPVVVVGGGNVAMDCVRSALRMGARSVHLLYRRGKADMPADHEEVAAAEAEGVQFHFLTNPARVVSENGVVTGVEVVEMRQTEPDEKGRRKVEPIPGSERIIPCHTLIAAIGQQVSGGGACADGIAMSKWHWVQVDSSTLATSRPGVFAGGDCSLGPSTLIHAMANGLKAARSIDDWIRFGRVRFFPRSRMRKLLNDNKMLAADCVEAPIRFEYRVHHPEIDPEVRKNMFEEVEGTISAEQAYHEAKRCMRCYRLYSVVTELPIPEGAI